MGSHDPAFESTNKDHVVVLCQSCSCTVLLQHVPLPEVPAGVGVGAHGRLHPGVPLRVPVAVLAAPAQCV